MSFPGYARYRDSGEEWLGEVPAHWTICLLKRAFRSVDYGISDSLDIEGAVAILRMGNIANGKVVTDDVKYTDSVDSRLLLQPGDLLYNRTNSLDLIGKVGMFLGHGESPVSFASYLVRLRTVAQSLPAYFAYLLNTDGILGLARASAFVAIGQCNLNPTRYGQITIAIPPLAEQTLIAEFLDKETAKIDALVGEQRRLIELLKEKRQAVISHAVTKGLNPHAPMKPSGIEWLGNFSAHWIEGVKLKTLALSQPASFTNGPFGSDLLTSELQDEGIPVIYIRDLKVSGYSRTSLSYVTADKAEQLDKFRVDPHDILIAKVGDPPGFCCTYPEDEPPGIICQDVIRIKPNLNIISPDYLCYLLNSPPGIEAIDSVSVELTRKRFSLADLQSLRFAFPPRREQDEIAARLKTVIGDFEALQAESQRAIDLLQERRTALISAAVTGKIDVRGLAESEAA